MYRMGEPEAWKEKNVWKEHLKTKRVTDILIL
jgi:hypothetical protein